MPESLSGRWVEQWYCLQHGKGLLSLPEEEKGCALREWGEGVTKKTLFAEVMMDNERKAKGQRKPRDPYPWQQAYRQ